MVCWSGAWPGSPAWAATFTVDSTLDAGDSSPGDGSCNDGGGNCTLRAAIQEANALAGTDNIHFSIAGGGPHTFTPASAYPTITGPVVIDGATEPDYGGTPVIELDGTGAGATIGLRLSGGSSTLRALVLNRFPTTAIMLETSGENTVQGCYIGTNVAGSAALANLSIGILIDGISNNTIGGTTAAQRNVISGNASGGVRIQTSGSGNVIVGNYIGTDVTGTVDLGNATDGVFIWACANNRIGGSGSGEGNLISGNNTYGVRILDPGATGNVVQGNLIGTNANGTGDLGNTLAGIYLLNCSLDTIGGTASGARNVISGNDQQGVNIATCSNTVVVGNHIGTNLAGTAAVPNTLFGIQIFSTSTNNRIGGPESGARNVISGNTLSGIHIRDSDVTGNVVAGNYIGVAADGTTVVANGDHGVQINTSAHGNTIGGLTSGAGNVISGNASSGIRITATGTNDNLVQGNYIGTDASGTLNIGNTDYGVLFDISDPSNNTVGGSASGAGNTIAYNGQDGVGLAMSGTGNAVLSNAIHDNGGLGIDLFGADGVTANDAGDTDTGGNDLQNHPTLTSATLGSTILSGTFNSTASSTFRLEFFSNSACDGSGNGEGEIYLGYADVTTDGSGNATFTDTFATTSQPGSFLTATATDGSNNTSEFSPCLALTSLPTPVLVGFTGSSFDPNATPDLDWGDVAGASTYSLQYATQSDFSDSTEVTGLTASVYSFGGKLGDDTYYWRVRAFGSGTASVFASADSFAIIPVMGVGVALLLGLIMAGYVIWRRA